MDLLQLSPLLNLGGWLVVVAAVVLAIRKGSWVPDFTVQRWFALYDQRIVDLKEQNSELKVTIKAANERADLQAETLVKLIPFVESASEAMKVVAAVASQRRD